MAHPVLDMHGNRDFKPFKCDFPNCTFSSLRKSNLELHKRRHAEGYGEKHTYICQICKETFPASSHSESNYVRHYRYSNLGHESNLENWNFVS